MLGQGRWATHRRAHELLGHLARKFYVADRFLVWTKLGNLFRHEPVVTGPAGMLAFQLWLKSRRRQSVTLNRSCEIRCTSKQHRGPLARSQKAPAHAHSVAADCRAQSHMF